MKTKLTVLLAVVFTLNSFASTDPGMQTSYKVSVSNFGNFNVHRQHNSAALSWTFNSSDVSTFIIKRSFDGDYFTTVDQKGVGTGHWHKFLDSTVDPGVSYYKIVAVMDDGTEEESSIAEVRIVKRR